MMGNHAPSPCVRSRPRGGLGDDGGVNQLADAPVFDAPDVDAQTSGVVTLTITSGTAGVADVKVYFQNADSSVVAVAMTDANGVASATMEAGGYVTAIDPFAAVSVPTGKLRKQQPASRVLRPWVWSARPASSSHR